MSIQKKIDSFLRFNDSKDEPLCLICLQKERQLPSRFLLEEDVCVCRECQKEFILHKKSYLIDQVHYHVLFEYDEWAQRLLFQYKEQRDIVLRRVFLSSQEKRFFEKMKKYTLVGLCSSEKKRQERGFEPLLEIFSEYALFVFSPFYKQEEIKQSSLSKQERARIQKILKIKEGYWMPKKKRMLVDDVLTTGNSVQAALSLIPMKEVFVLFAHPLWIESHQKDVKKHDSFFI